MRAAEEVLEHGTFKYAREAVRDGELRSMMPEAPVQERT
jgi:hypothetical protein